MELVKKIAEVGTYAPSGLNRQPTLILAVTDKQMRDKLSRLNAKILGRDMDPFYNAPVVYVVLSNRDASTYLYDGSLVMGNLLHAAHEAGLGACWIHRAKEMFDSDEGREILRSLGIGDEYEGIGNCVVGYPDAPVREAPPRKENLIYYID